MMFGLSDQAFISGFCGGVCVSLLGWSLKALTQKGMRTLPPSTGANGMTSTIGLKAFERVKNFVVYVPDLTNIDETGRSRLAEYLSEFRKTQSNSFLFINDEKTAIESCSIGCIDAPTHVTKNSSLDVDVSFFSIRNSTNVTFEDFVLVGFDGDSFFEVWNPVSQASTVRE